MALTEDELRGRLREQAWTAHNLELAPGVFTRPGGPPFESTNFHLQAILRLLGILYPQGLAGVRVADLGCLEGGFSLALARRGARVTGVEVRADNVDKCELVREQAGLPGLRFVHCDVRQFERWRFGGFDVVLALGILYHLDDPVPWMHQLASLTDRVLLVDTHFAPEDDAALAELDPRLRGVGALEERAFGGFAYRGRRVHEFDDADQGEATLWASYSNAESFWLTKESLLAGLTACGFPAVWELHDHFGSQHTFFNRRYPRCFLAALKA